MSVRELLSEVYRRDRVLALTGWVMLALSWSATYGAGRARESGDDS